MTDSAEDRYFDLAATHTFAGEQYVAIRDYRSLASALRSLRVAHNQSRADSRKAIAELDTTIAKLFARAMELAGSR
jgi:1,6-anhydro-N-acetylmuramate kinase